MVRTVHKRLGSAFAAGTRWIRRGAQIGARWVYANLVGQKKARKWVALTAAGLILVIMVEGGLRAVYYNFADPEIPKTLYYRARANRYTPADNISAAAQQALVVTEDCRFGHRLLGLPTAKELWRGLVQRPLRLRLPWIPETLEAQTAKLTSFWGTEPPRLLKPLFRAVEALQAAPYALLLPDERILSMYLNLIPVARHVYGIRDGAKYYFRKRPHQLTRNEAAVLFAKLPAPFAWSLRHKRVRVRIKRATGYNNAQYKKHIVPLIRRAERNSKAVRNAYRRRKRKNRRMQETHERG